MKLKKRILSVLLIGCMIFGSSMTAFADAGRASDVSVGPEDCTEKNQEMLDGMLKGLTADIQSEYESNIVGNSTGSGTTNEQKDALVRDVLHLTMTYGELLETISSMRDSLSTKEVDGKTFYVLYDEEDLINFRRIVNIGYLFTLIKEPELAKEAFGYNAMLGADIDFTDYDWENNTLYGHWEGIGTWDVEDGNAYAYTGTFDGNGHVIKGLTLNDDDYVCGGLFGCTKGATIKNLGLEDVTIHGLVCMGAVVGYADVGTTILSCYGQGTVTAEYKRAGGIAGHTQGCTIRRCYFVGTLTSVGTPGAIGAISAFSGYDDVIANCYYEKGTKGVLEGNTHSGIVSVEEKTAEQFASGEVTYLLNLETEAASHGYYQTVGEGLPAFNGKQVYKYTFDDTVIYSNKTVKDWITLGYNVSGNQLISANQGTVTNPETGSSETMDKVTSPKTSDGYSSLVFAIVCGACLCGIVVSRKRHLDY